jgi:hypothetical protein
MQFPRFYQELSNVTKNLGDSFLKSQSKEWHSKVASSSFAIATNSGCDIDVPLIPLRDGRWVKPSQSHLFFEGETTDAVVPGGLDICLVDHEASQD